MDNNSYARDGMKLIVEEQDGVMEIVYAEMTVQETVFLIGALTGKVADIVGQSVNDTLEDFKEQESI
jgi:hypothetical protein